MQVVSSYKRCLSIQKYQLFAAVSGGKQPADQLICIMLENRRKHGQDNHMARLCGLTHSVSGAPSNQSRFQKNHKDASQQPWGYVRRLGDDTCANFALLAKLAASTSLTTLLTPWTTALLKHTRNGGKCRERNTTISLLRNVQSLVKLTVSISAYVVPRT